MTASHDNQLSTALGFNLQTVSRVINREDKTERQHRSTAVTGKQKPQERVALGLKRGH